MKRVLGIDFGLARIGLAISDEKKTFALALKTIKGAKTVEKTVTNVYLAIEDRLDEIDTIVVGLPLYLDGTDSNMTRLVRKFANILQKKTNLPIVLFDERLTSEASKESLKILQMKRKKTEKMVDQASSIMILQNYLDARN